MIQKLEHCVRGTDNGCSGASFSEVIDKVNEVIDYINSRPEENNPEPYNPVYDEDYLNEKIAKATKSWEGVDVDAMLAECRGYEENPSEDLEEAAEKYALLFEDGTKWKDGGKYKGFIAGAEWQEKQDLRWAGEIHKNGYNLCKEQMMKDAVEGEIVKDITNKLAVTAKNINLDGFKFGDKVKIIIVNED